MSAVNLDGPNQRLRDSQMKPKSLVKAGFLVIVLGGLVYFGVKGLQQRGSSDPIAVQDVQAAPKESTTATPPQKTETDKIIAYYFHTTYRCATCRRIEVYSKQAIDFGFAPDVAKGRLEFRLVNVELPENQHFVQDYKLFTKSLVLVRFKNGRPVEWKNLSKVWELTGEHDAFLSYVRGEVSAYLEKN
jgi:hypothetical protein